MPDDADKKTGYSFSLRPSESAVVEARWRHHKFKDRNEYLLAIVALDRDAAFYSKIDEESGARRLHLPSDELPRLKSELSAITAELARAAAKIASMEVERELAMEAEQTERAATKLEFINKRLEEEKLLLARNADKASEIRVSIARIQQALNRATTDKFHRRLTGERFPEIPGEGSPKGYEDNSNHLRDGEDQDDSKQA